MAASRAERGAATPSSVRSDGWCPASRRSRMGACVASRMGDRDGGEAGWLSLEAVLLLPVVALLAVGMLELVAVGRDVLLLHEAARAGARAAATSTGLAEVRTAVGAVDPDGRFAVEVDPVQRGDGDLVTVTVATQRRLGPVTHTLRARAVARVEPAIGSSAGHGAGP